MAENNNFSFRNCLVWKFSFVQNGFMRESCQSPDFTFLGKAWNFTADVKCDTYNFNRPEIADKYGTFSFRLHGKDQKILQENANITVFVKDGSGNLILFPRTMTVNKSDISIAESGISMRTDQKTGHWTLVCIFLSECPVQLNEDWNETMCLTSRQPSPQAPDSNLENLSSDFEQFLKDTTFTDVTLKCSDSTMSAHRSVLAARSPVFAAMFRNKEAECENGVVQIDDMDPDTLESFLKFLYSGKITDLSEKNVSILFLTSDKYNVRRLQQQCSQWIIENLTLKNCIGFLQLADTHNYEDLKNSVVNFIVRDNSVFQRKEWAQLKELNSKLANFVYEKYICKYSNINIA